MKKIIFILMCLFPVFVLFIANDILLEFAAKNNFIPMAKLCLFIGANANSKYYPLTAAVKNNYIKMADLLIKKGANINIEDKNIATPLEIAVTNDNTDMTKLLLKNGASASNNSNKLLATAVKNNSTYMVDLLLENGADLNIENEQGKTPLEIAVEKDNADMVKFLLQKGANPNIKNKYGETPIWKNYLQYECADNEVRSELLAAGAEDTICIVWGKAETYVKKHQFKSALKVINDNSATLGKAKNKMLDKINNAQNKYIEEQINEYIDKNQFQSARQFVKQNKKNLNKDNYDYWLFEIDLLHVSFIEQVLEEVAPYAGRFYSGRYCYDFVYKLEYISTVFPREMYKNQKNAGVMMTEYKGFVFTFMPFGTSVIANKYMKDLQNVSLSYTYKDGTIICESFNDSYTESICKKLHGFRFLERGVGVYVPFVKYVKTGLPTPAGSCYR